MSSHPQSSAAQIRARLLHLVASKTWTISRHAVSKNPKTYACCSPIVASSSARSRWFSSTSTGRRATAFSSSSSRREQKPAGEGMRVERR